MKFLKRQLKTPSQTPRKKRVAKKWANESSHGTRINRLLTRKLGAAPILQHFIERMGVVSNIDRLVQAHEARRISHGEAVAGLMVYLLNGGRALYRMEQWAGQTAVLSWLFPQYAADEWTDDRLAATLDALYQAGLESVQGELSAHIVEVFGLKLSEIHYDTTSVSLWGTYDAESGQPAVLITFGHSKDHRPDLKQVVVGSAVSGDGGVPLLSKTHDGNTSDSTVPIPYWERLRQLAGTSEFCFIGDCKLASQKNLKAICTADGIFLSPLAMSTTEQASIRRRLQSGELVFKPLDMPEAERLKVEQYRFT
jgi:transposase